MRIRFSIGEMSKLHNVPVKTLRYYDEIGLFTPAEVDGLNGYRYYAIEQFEQLNTINYLKFLGFPLKDIQVHLRQRDAVHFLNVLRKQQEITDNTIRKLEIVNKRFTNRINEIESSLIIDALGQPQVKRMLKRRIIQIRERIHSEPEWELALRRLANIVGGNPSLFIGNVGLTIAKENLMKNIFSEYDSVFILWEEAIESSEWVTHLDDGDYACIYFRGSHNDSIPYYEELLHFIGKHGYEIAGGSIERTIINQYVTLDRNLHLTEIQLPVRMLS